jgi:hypothetical protein
MHMRLKISDCTCQTLEVGERSGIVKVFASESMYVALSLTSKLFLSGRYILATAYRMFLVFYICISTRSLRRLRRHRERLEMVKAPPRYLGLEIWWQVMQYTFQDLSSTAEGLRTSMSVRWQQRVCTDQLAR